MRKINFSILWQFFTRFGAAFFNLLIGILISQYLGSDGRGIHGLFIASVALIHLFTNWLGGASLVYLAPRYSVRQLSSISFWWTTVFAIACWLILAVLGLMPEGMEFSILISALVFAWWNNLANMLLGKSRTENYNVLQLTHTLITAAIVALAFWLREATFSNFILAYGCAQLANLVLAGWYLKDDYRNSPKEKDPLLFKAFLRHGLYIQLANVTQFFNYRILYFLIDHYFGKGVLGIYSNALSLAESVWMVSRSISTVQFAKIANSKNRRFNRKLTQRYAFISLVVSGIGIAALVALPDTFFVWLFGEEFYGIHEILLWLSPAILSMSIGNIYAHYFAGLGMNKVNFFGSLINLVLLLAVFFLNVVIMGVMAAPFAVSCAFAAAMIYHACCFRWLK